MAVDIGNSLFVAVYDLEAASNASTLHGGGKRLIRQGEPQKVGRSAVGAKECGDGNDCEDDKREYALEDT